jgi:hypothetical protein
MKIKINKNVIANIQGKSVHLSEGQITDVDKESADNLVRGHYAELMNDNKPATKVKIAPSKIKVKVK